MIVDEAKWAALIDENLPPPALWPDRLYRLPTLQYPETLNLAEQLLRAGNPHATAIIWRGDRVTYDPVMQRVQLLADRAAQGTINVLIVGENGVGKEILAEGIHRRSARADKPRRRKNHARYCSSLTFSSQSTA